MPGRPSLLTVAAFAAVAFTAASGFPVPAGILVLGAVIGSLVALIAAGIVLIYRTHRAVNLAQAEIGATAAVAAVLLSSERAWSYPAAVGVAIGGAVLLGFLIDRVIMHRFLRRGPFVLMAASLAVAQLLAALQSVLPRAFGVTLLTADFGTPWSTEFWVGVAGAPRSVRFDGNHLIAILLAPLAIGAVAAFLRFTRTGLRARAMADDTTRAAALGIPTAWISNVVWMIAGGLAGLGALLRAPTLGLAITGGSFGPGLMLRALVPAILGRLENMKTTVLAAIFVGMLDQAVLYRTGDPALADASIVGLLVVGLLLRRAKTIGRQGLVDTPRVLPARPLPERLRAHVGVRWFQRSARVAVGAAVLVPLMVLPRFRAMELAFVLILGLLGISMVLLVGWAGEISLGHAGLAAVGAAMTGWAVMTRAAPLLPSVGLSILAGAGLAAVAGAPAMRARTSVFAVTSLGFGVASVAVIARLAREGIVPSSRFARPSIGVLRFDDERVFALTVGLIFLAVVVGATMVRAGRFGRALMAVRDNEAFARALGWHAGRVRLTAFALSGAVAGLAGALHALHQNAVSVGGLGVRTSLDAFAAVVVGGPASVTGGAIGALVLEAARRFLTPVFALVGSGVALLAVLLVVPGGLASLVSPVRDRIARRIARDRLVPVRDEQTVVLSGALGAEDPLLVVDGLSVAYGRDQIIADTSLAVARGEVVAIVGENGIGKSTLLRAIAGAIPHRGSIEVAGVQLSARQHRRAREGVAWLAGDASVFPSLTVADNLRVAGGAPGRATATFAAAIDKRHVHAADLSGGERAQLALAMSLSTDPRVLLVDEVTAGLSAGIARTTLEQIRLAAATRAVIMVDQSAEKTRGIADRVIVASRVAQVRTPALVRGGGQRPAPVLTVRGLSKRFDGIQAIDDVSFEMAPGSIVGIVGSNGAGKTTLFDVMAGALSADRGEVLLDGVALAGGPEARANAGMFRSFQSAALFPALTVREAVTLAAEGIGRVDSGRRAADALRTAGVDGFADLLVAELSYGMRQLTGLACVVAAGPSILLLDEPVAGLAPATRASVFEVIRALRDRDGVSMLVIEHDLAGLAAVADRFLALDAGKVVQDGDPRDVLERWASDVLLPLDPSSPPRPSMG